MCHVEAYKKPRKVVGFRLKPVSGSRLVVDIGLAEKNYTQSFYMPSIITGVREKGTAHLPHARHYF